ncbi:hypothetical protein QTN73_30610, partial [Escherichia coli]
RTSGEKRVFLVILFTSFSGSLVSRIPGAVHRRFDSFTHVNQQLEQWIADVADKRELRQFKETPEQRFALEQEYLQPLP